MVTKKASFLATFAKERDGTYYAVVRVAPRSTAFSSGDTLDECRANIRDSVEGLIESDAFELDEVEVSQAAMDAVQEYFIAKDEKDAADARSRAASVGVARALTGDGVSMRRVGEILGLTGPRVHQLVAEGAAERKRVDTKIGGLMRASVVEGGKGAGSGWVAKSESGRTTHASKAAAVQSVRHAKTSKTLSASKARARPKTA